ncbi:hypothetical protein [Tenacibaculum finnmarkense]|uniref:hypothetical protein n=1 Tax=Tenacibaculum finnmarkense TaxID=2781243 RepID=UPI0018E985AF|nr:hypothetical protein [Tenacibaculum finnmarkense]
MYKYYVYSYEANSDDQIFTLKIKHITSNQLNSSIEQQLNKVAAYDEITSCWYTESFDRDCNCRYVEVNFCHSSGGGGSYGAVSSGGSIKTIKDNLNNYNTSGNNSFNTNNIGSNSSSSGISYVGVLNPPLLECGDGYERYFDKDLGPRGQNICKRIAIENFLGLSLQETNWLNKPENKLIKTNIENFLDKNNSDADAKNWIKQAFEELITENEIDYNVSNLVDAEPVKKYMGTISNFKFLLDNSPRKVGEFKGVEASDYLKSLGETKFNLSQFRPLPTQTGFFNNKIGRYIYTKKGGWIDMAHFMFYAGKAYQYKLNGKINPIGEAVQDGFKQELSDSFVAKHSAYSYEDLPSDKFGAKFAVNHFNIQSNLTFSEQLTNYFNNVLKASTPKSAPNYNDTPSNDSKNNPTKTNKTTTPIFTLQNNEL